MDARWVPQLCLLGSADISLISVYSHTLEGCMKGAELKRPVEPNSEKHGRRAANRAPLRGLLAGGS